MKLNYNMQNFINHLNTFKNGLHFKEYNNEKAIISLTSWTKRINHCDETIKSLIKNCKGFHIVLVLAVEEFPNRERDLPKQLLKLHDYFEILWVEKNYKAFKKVIFTMDKYRDIPVISADDDLIYTTNYAQRLYNKWIDNKKSFITYMSKNKFNTWGFGTLFPPYVFKEYGIKMVEMLYNNIKTNKVFCDDGLYAFLRKKNKMNVISFNSNTIYKIHHSNDSISMLRKKNNKNFYFYDNLMEQLWENICITT